MDGKAPQGDTEIVGALLEAVEGLTGREVADAVAGVSTHDISRWRAGQYSRLTEPKRQAILDFLFVDRVRSTSEFWQGAEYAVMEMRRRLDALGTEIRTKRAELTGANGGPPTIPPSAFEEV